MNIRIISLLLGATIALTACDRQKPVSPDSNAPPKTTVGTEIDDTVLTAKVKSALLDGNDTRAAIEIKVETRKGVALLSGFVDSQARAESAIAVARAVQGVKGVENGITIRADKVSVGNTVDDSIVTARVKAVFISDPTVNSADISVVTRKGVVQLSGFVNNQIQIDRAVDLARAVEGARSVVSELGIKK